MSGLPPAVIAGLFRAACQAELEALKPGNVHVHADGPRHDRGGLRRERRGGGAASRRPGPRRRRADPGRGRGDARRLRPEHQSRHPAAVRAAGGGRRGRRRPCGRAWPAVLDGLDRARRRARLPGDPAGGAGRASAAATGTTWPTSRRSRCSRRCGRPPGATGSPRNMSRLRRRVRASASRGCWPAARPAGPSAGPSPPPILAFLAAFPDTHVVRKHGADGGRAAAGRGARRSTGSCARPAQPEALLDRLLALDRELEAARDQSRAPAPT